MALVLGLIERQVERLAPKCPIGAQLWILVDPVDPLSAEEDSKIRELGRKVLVPEIGRPKVLVDLLDPVRDVRDGDMPQSAGICDLCEKFTHNRDPVSGRFRCPGCVPL